MSQSVFISYAREDDEPFVKRIHKDLTRAGFEVWWDRVSMPSRRLTFHQEIADAIRSHDRLILVLGPRAAVSDYVRQEWRWALDLDKPVIPILRKGDYTDLPGELSSLQCDDFRDYAQYRVQLAKLIENLRRPEPPLGGLFGVPSLPPHFLGRPDLLRQVKAVLLMDLERPVVITASDARVGMHGMGGIGKSVLAAAIARDREVRRSYPDGVIWLTVGQQPNLVRLQHDVAHHLGNKEHFDTEPQGRGVLRQLLARRAVLLVLDDVWNAHDTEAFDVLGPRCRTLVTTRDAGILHTLGGPSVPVDFLTEKEALQLLADAVGVEPSALPPQAHEVVKECGCLALGVALCGGMVKKRVGDWAAILERLRKADLEKIADRQAIDERHQSIWRTMQVSVDVLPADEQRRFAELTVFVRDEPVPEAAIATLWSHEGNLSDLDTTDLLINLAERSLIRLHQQPAERGEPVERRISLHDFLYNFATRRAGPPKPLHRTLLDAYRTKCTNGWPTGPNDGYFYQHLAYHLHAGAKQQELKKVLFDYRWLDRKLEVAGVNGLISDYDFFNDDSLLRLVQRAIGLSAHVLAEDKSQLAGQLFGRLLSQKDRRVKSLLNQAAEDQSAPWLRPLTKSLMGPTEPLLRTLECPGDRVQAVAITQDARYALCGLVDGALKVWDCETGNVIHKLRGHRHHVKVVAVTPDGRYAVSGSVDNTLKVWDLKSGAALHTLDGHEGSVLAVAVGPDAHYVVSGSEDTTVKVWDLQTGVLVRSLDGHTGYVLAVALTSDGRYAVTGSNDRTLKVWDLDIGKVVHTLRGHEGSVRAVAVTPDCRYAVSGSADKTLKVWDLRTGKPARGMKGDANHVTAVAVSPDGRHVVSVHNLSHTPIRVWDLQTRRQVHSVNARSGEVLYAAVTGDAGYAILASVFLAPGGGPPMRLTIWEVQVGNQVRSLGESPVLSFHRAMLSPGIRYFAQGWIDGEVMIQDRQTSEVKTLHHGSQPTFAVALTSDGRYAVSGSWDATLKVWDVARGAELHTLTGHEGKVTAVAVTPNGRYAISGSSDRTVKVWDLNRGTEVRTLTSHEDAVTTVVVTPDGRYVVSGARDRRLKVCDLEAGKCVQVMKGHKGTISDIGVTPDGRYAVSGSRDQTVKVWEIRTGRLIASFRGETDISACGVKPKEHTIVAMESSGRLHFLRLENVK